MNTQDVLDPKSWAERTFGSIQLHEKRRTGRAVQAATNLAENPKGFSACSHAHLERDQSVASFARAEPDVTFAALMQPHVQQFREQATSAPAVLLVQDQRSGTHR